MSITPEQAKVELAKRELERRQANQPPQQGQTTQGQPNVMQQLLQATKNVGEGIVNPPYRIAAHTLQGLEGLIRGGQASTYTNPVTGDVVEPYTDKTKLSEAIGLGLQGGAIAMGSPVLGGATYGVGQGMEEGNGALDIAGKGIAGGVLGYGLGAMAGRYKPTLKNEKLASRVINSLIKPSRKEIMFGDPGRGITKEGITANSLEELYNKVDQRISFLDDAVKIIRNTPENIEKTVDISKVKSPLISAVTELRKAPKVHAAEITNIENALSDLGKLNKGKLDKLSVSETYKIKKIVSGMQKWSMESKAGNEVNTSLRKVYHYIDEQLDNTIPELKELNSRMADLIPAKQAIDYRIGLLNKQEPMPTMFKVMDLPFMALKTPTAKTTLGKLLARQYKLPKK